VESLAANSLAGFTVEVLTYGRVTFQAIKLQLKQKSSTIRKLEDNHFLASDAVIFVIDCNDWEQMGEVRDGMWHLLQRRDPVKGVAEVQVPEITKVRPLLVLAIKDLQVRKGCSEKVQESCSANEVIEAFEAKRPRCRGVSLGKCNRYR
jgi:hypothetical protein